MKIFEIYIYFTLPKIQFAVFCFLFINTFFFYKKLINKSDNKIKIQRSDAKLDEIVIKEIKVVGLVATSISIKLSYTYFPKISM